MKKKQIIWRRSISIFLALLLCLTLLPAAALAANTTTPRITAIGGNENQNISTTQSGSGWSYDAGSKTLTLNGYSGGRIEVVGDKKQDFTLKLVGNNTIKNNSSGYGLTVTSEDTSYSSTTANYMTLTITSDQYATLTVNGISIGGRINFEIAGNASITSRTTARNLCALKGADPSAPCSVSIQGNANVHLASGFSQTENTFCLVPIYGNLTVNTTGYVEIDASSTGGPAIQLYGSVNTFLYKVKELLIKWNTGGCSLHMSNTSYAENKGQTSDGYGIAIYHTPYVEVTVPSGTLLEYQRINLTKKSFIRVGEGERITITANAPEAGKRFKNWTLACKGLTMDDLKFVAGNANTASFTIEIPDPEKISPSGGFHTLNFTPNYEDIPTTDVTLDKTTLALVNGNSGKLTATVEPSEASQSVTWDSDNETVATVDEDGTVHAVGAGTATITATTAVAAADGLTPFASCTVTVKEAEYTVTLDPNEGTIADGKNVTGYVRGTSAALPTAADITREGYLFKGWYETADFSGSPVTAITATDTGDKTFYAKWAEAYTVTAYGLYGGAMGITPGETFTAKYAAGDTVGLQIGKRDGYTLRSLTLEGISEDALTWAAEGEENEQRGIEFTMPAESVTVTVNWRSNSSGSSSSSGSSYAVSAPSAKNGDVTVSPKNASKGDRVTITVKPDSGYEVGSVTVLDSKGNELKLTDKGDGKYTFTMPGSKVTVSAEFVEEQAASIFADVPADAYHAKAVEWAVKKGITNGKANGLFGSNDPCTRGQIVTFLWRAAGSPAPKGTAKVPTDVLPGSYCYDAVAWAIENGVTNGFADGTFGVNSTCTRGQSVTFLYRALGTAPTTVNGFTDVAAGDFYAEAVAWAVENGVTNGTTDSTFSPNNGCTRAQIVMFLLRTMN